MSEVLDLDWGFIKNADWLPDGERISVIASGGDSPRLHRGDAAHSRHGARGVHQRPH